MRHATSDDLVGLTGVLSDLRAVSGLIEKRPGIFYRSGRAFCHFHADEAGLFADVRVADDFERVRVSTVREQRAFVTTVRRAVRRS